MAHAHPWHRECSRKPLVLVPPRHRERERAALASELTCAADTWACALVTPKPAAITPPRQGSPWCYPSPGIRMASVLSPWRYMSMAGVLPPVSHRHMDSERAPLRSR